MRREQAEGERATASAMSVTAVSASACSRLRIFRSRSSSTAFPPVLHFFSALTLADAHKLHHALLRVEIPQAGCHEVGPYWWQMEVCHENDWSHRRDELGINCRLLSPDQ